MTSHILHSDVTDVITFRLVGYNAIAYASYTGRKVSKAEIKYYPGVVEPAQELSADDAWVLLQPDPPRRLRVALAEHFSIDARLGERPYSGSGPVDIDWAGLHCAAILVDSARRSPLREPFGYASSIDAFGGSYSTTTYEPNGLAGAVRILQGADRIRHDVWAAIHGARNHDSGQGVARAALRTALALHHLYVALDAIGIHRYRPAEEICGVSAEGVVAVTGMRWLEGERLEDRPYTLAETIAFVQAVRS